MSLQPFNRLERSLALAVAAVGVAACTVNVQTPAQPPAAGAPSQPAAPAQPVVPAQPAAPVIVVVDRAASPKVKTADEEGLDLLPEEGEPVEVETYLDDDELGVDIEDFRAESGFDEDNDGIEEVHASMKVGGEGLEDHEILFEEEDAPVMSEDFDMLAITDKTANETRTFAADQEFSRFEIRKESAPGLQFRVTSSDEEKLVFSITPEGTFMVGEQSASSVEAAAQLLVESPVLKGGSKQTLTALYGRLLNYQQKATRGGDAGAIANQAGQNVANGITGTGEAVKNSWNNSSTEQKVTTIASVAAAALAGIASLAFI